MDTLRDFLDKFSGYIYVHIQNCRDCPVPEGNFNPKILRSIEVKYGIDFSFDNWIFRKGVHGIGNT